jgi:hypothetical protein
MGKKRPSTSSTVQIPKKVRYEKHCNLCKKHGGMHTAHSISECHKYKKDGTEKSSFCATKKGGKKKYPVNQNITQLTKKIDKLEKVLKKSGNKGKKCHYDDNNSNSECGVRLGSTRKVIKLGETIKNTSYTPPSPIKATPSIIASNSNDVSTASVSKADNVMMTSSDQTDKLFKKKNVTPNKDPPEGKTTVIVAVMRGRPKHSHHHQHSNKHYKRILVRVLLDSGSDGDLILYTKVNPCCFPPQKGWLHSHGIL